MTSAAADVRLVSASAYWVRAPLRRPYGLSFGTLRAFDLVLVRLVDDTGRVGFGESCPIPPYSPESADQVWARVGETLASLPDRGLTTVLDDLVRRADSPEAFSYVAPTTALEALLDPPDIRSELVTPVVGTVQAARELDIPDETQRLVDLGHKALKVKVGFNPVDDLRRVELVRACAPAGTVLRLDANEAWDLSHASRFLSGLDPDGIELVEQPLPRERWDWFTTLADAHREIPLMLDESIQSDESVRRAADSGARIVKFKLMKAGSRRRLRQRTELARSLGLSVVIGNGVAGVTDNWYEAHCARGTGRVGEMNGSLKLKEAVFDPRPVLAAGCLRFPSGFEPNVGVDVLEQRSKRSVRAL